MNEDSNVCDILCNRRKTSDIIWASRKWKPTKAHMQTVTLGGDEIKSIVLHSKFLKYIINKIHHRQKVPIYRLYKNAEDILKDIGFYRQVTVIRWFGVFISKVLKKLYSAVYVNEKQLLKIKYQMGGNPVLFVPTHKSYCDFVLMAYICFHFDIDIPRIAAGNDFQSMAIIGKLLRDACAFFIRRSFNNDELYSSVFSQYVQTLITDGDGPVEFFIEGTRSRTAKSLVPKYGFLSMALKPFFLGLVPDITVIPVNLNYDKILEELLFAYELLGIPKPKESTKGFLKALSILNQNYGSVYVNFGEPISIKKYLGDKIDRSVHNVGPVHLQKLSPTENSLITDFAYEIIKQQKKLTVLNCFNLIALIINDNIASSKDALNVTSLLSEVKWLLSIFRILFPDFAIKDITKEHLLSQLHLHTPLVALTKDNRIHLGKLFYYNIEIKPTELKGHKLEDGTLHMAVPMILLQNYINPSAYLLAPASFIALIINSVSNTASISKDHLFNDFQFLYSVFSIEFVYHMEDVQKDFDAALNKSFCLGITDIESNTIKKGVNEKLRTFCSNFINSFIPGYISVTEILMNFVECNTTERELLQASQERVEMKLNGKKFVHPNNLSLDVLKNALQAFVFLGAAFRTKGYYNITDGYDLNFECYHFLHSEPAGAVLLREYIKGSYITPILLYSCSQKQRSASFVHLKNANPDSYAGHLICKYVYFSDLCSPKLRKKVVDMARNLRKCNGWFLNQGIPDPSLLCYFEEGLEFVDDLDDGRKKHNFCFSLCTKTNKKKVCHCCERKYLFECPDAFGHTNHLKDVTNLKCSCAKCHPKHLLEDCKNYTHYQCFDEPHDRPEDALNHHGVNVPDGKVARFEEGTFHRGSKNEGTNTEVVFVANDVPKSMGNQRFEEEIANAPITRNKYQTPVDSSETHIGVCCCPYPKKLQSKDEKEKETEDFAETNSADVRIENYRSLKCSKAIQTNLRVNAFKKKQSKAEKNKRQCECTSECIICQLNRCKECEIVFNPNPSARLDFTTKQSKNSQFNNQISTSNQNWRGADSIPTFSKTLCRRNTKEFETKRSYHTTNRLGESTLCNKGQQTNNKMEHTKLKVNQKTYYCTFWNRPQGKSCERSKERDSVGSILNKKIQYHCITPELPNCISLTTSSQETNCKKNESPFSFKLKSASRKPSELGLSLDDSKRTLITCNGRKILSNKVDATLMTENCDKNSRIRSPLELKYLNELKSDESKTYGLISQKGHRKGRRLRSAASKHISFQKSKGLTVLKTVEQPHIKPRKVNKITQFESDYNLRRIYSNVGNISHKSNNPSCLNIAETPMKFSQGINKMANFLSNKPTFTGLFNTYDDGQKK